MLTLDQLISEATALSDEAKALLIDKIVESMTVEIDGDVSIVRSEESSRTHYRNR